MTADLHHLAAAYSLDALDDDERAEFEAHLPTCDMCRDEVAEFRETVGHLSAATAAVPPADLKARVMTDVADTRQESPIVTSSDGQDGQVADVVDLSASRRRISPVGVLAAAAAVILLVVGTVAIVGGGDTNDLDAVLSAPDAVVTSLDTTEAAGAGSVRVVWSAERDEVAVFASDLADPGAGKAYALWLLGADGTPVPAGLFTPDDGSIEPTVFEVDDIDSGGWGITIEPDSGSDAPTTDILFLTQYEA